MSKNTRLEKNVKESAHLILERFPNMTYTQAWKLACDNGAHLWFNGSPQFTPDVVSTRAITRLEEKLKEGFQLFGQFQDVLPLKLAETGYAYTKGAAALVPESAHLIPKALFCIE